MEPDEIELKDVSEAITEVKKGFEAFKEAHAEELKGEVKGQLDVLLTEKLDRINKDLAEKQELIDKVYASTRRKTILLDGKEVSEEELDAKALHWAKGVRKSFGEEITEYGHTDLNGYKSAFGRYLRKDDRILSADEQKALSVGSDPDGGYVVHPEMGGRVVKRIFETSPIRSYASTQVISSDALEGIHDLDEAASGWVAETAGRPETGTPKLDMWRIPVHEQYAEPRATQKLLDDAEINIEQWLGDKVADRMMRTENTAFINGDGVVQPRGILTYPDGSTLPGEIEQIATGVNGDFAADPDGGDVLIDAITALKEGYRANATWYMSRSTTGRIRKLQDNDGNYLWQPSFQAGQPAMLMGFPTAGFEDIPDFNATDALGIIFGDMAEGYQIVDRMGFRVLRDPYTAKPFVKFYTTKRVGGDVLNFEALKLIRFGT